MSSELAAVVPSSVLKPAQVKRLLARASAEQHSHFLREHTRWSDTFQRNAHQAARFASCVSVDERKVRELWKSRQGTLTKQWAKLKPPSFAPIAGHNPARYAPFDARHASFAPAAAWHGFYGPDRKTGQAGGWLVSSSQGNASMISGVGFGYVCPSDATARIRMNARIWYYVGAFGAFGTCEAQVSLRLTVLAISNRFPFTQVHESSKLVRKVAGAWLGTGESEEIGSKRNPDLQSSTELTLPVHRNTFYVIWASIDQRVGVGGLALARSDCNASIGPITIDFV